MALSMQPSASGDFRDPEPGLATGVLTRIIELGHQPMSYQGEHKPDAKKLMLYWEIDQIMDDGRPFLVVKTYTQSWHAKANLRQDMESWRGRAFADDEGFDIRAALGKSCTLNLVKRDEYLNVHAVMPARRGVKLEPQGPLMIFDLDEPDWGVFEQLSHRVQDKIARSPEYQGIDHPPRQAPAQAPQQPGAQQRQADMQPRTAPAQWRQPPPRRAAVPARPYPQQAPPQTEPQADPVQAEFVEQQLPPNMLPQHHQSGAAQPPQTQPPPGDFDDDIPF